LREEIRKLFIRQSQQRGLERKCSCTCVLTPKDTKLSCIRV
jgi:hypothetical protein